MSSSASGICVAANADVSAACCIVVAADGIDTFSNEVSGGTNGDAVIVATVDLALIKPNLDMSTITAESRDRSVLVLGCCCYNVCGAGPWVVDVRSLNQLFFVFAHLLDSRVSLVTGQQCRHRLASSV